jgi:hypothetical protein
MNKRDRKKATAIGGKAKKPKEMLPSRGLAKKAAKQDVEQFLDQMDHATDRKAHEKDTGKH